MSRIPSASKPLALALVALAGVCTLADAARAQTNFDGREELYVCQRLLGEDVSECVAQTAFSIVKTIDDDLFEQPNRQAVGYVVTVVEGNTRYALTMTSLVTLTGAQPEGSVVSGIVASLQKKSPGEDGFTTVASALVGNADPACGCPFVGSADLSVSVQGGGVTGDPGGDDLIEYLGFGDSVTLQLDATYRLGAGIVLPNDEVRFQSCVQWRVADEADLPGCFTDGGGTRVVRACSTFDFAGYADPKSAVVDVKDILPRPEQDWVLLNGFRASSSSPNVTPHDTPLTLVPGGEAKFAVAATGLPGTVSQIAVTGDVSCGQRVTCEAEASLCFAELWNDAILDYRDERGTVSVSAMGEIVCKPFECLPGDLAACDDGNPCTIDGCTPNVGCTNTPHTGACDDGNPCTSGETCATGTCAGGGATQCPGGSQCVDAWCDPELGCRTLSKPNRSDCNDGNACTVDDACIDGTCSGGAPRQCNDNNACTADSCNPQTGCVNAAVGDGAGCSDGNVCTTGDRCVGGHCSGTGALGCDDGNPCTIDRCDPNVPNGCVHDNAPSTTVCNDNNACTDGDVCQSGTCQGAPKTCDDGNECTNNRCDIVAGCFYPPRTGSCDDASVCSTQSACIDGQCRPTALVSCDDGNSCSLDTCHPTTGCQHQTLGNGVACDDDNPCTSGDQCQSGLCVFTGQTVCDDGKQCTESTCLDEIGCVHTPRSGTCEDGNACTAPDQCDAGNCLAGAARNCDDHNPCTIDSCNVASGCVNTPISGGGCDDSDPCTSPGVCQTGTCVQQMPVVCNDGNPCTDDRCDAGVGCVAPARTGSCDDSDPCTADGTCSGGICQKGPALVCNDGNECTLDFCRQGVGCQTLARDQVPCSDGNNCTIGDMCVAGVCKGSAPLDCNDNNPCTDDVCTPTGCQNLVRTGACEDGNLCTVGDTCQAGQCVPGAPKACADDNSCTSDGCDTATGQCRNTSLADGAICDDQDACSGCVWPEAQVVEGFNLKDAVPDATIFTVLPPTGVLDLDLFANGQRVVMTAGSELRFVRLTATTARIRGNLLQGNATWRIEIDLSYRGEGPTGQGPSPFRELPTGYQPTIWTDKWRYWQPNGLVRIVSASGEVVTLSADPTYGSLPLQTGTRANGRDLSDGLSWPLRWTRSNGLSGQGVLRGTLERVWCQVADRCAGSECIGGSERCPALRPGMYCAYYDSEVGAPCLTGQTTQVQCLLQNNFAKIAVEKPVCSSQLVYAFGFSVSGASMYRRYAFNSAAAIASFLPTTSAFTTSPAELCNPSPSFGNRFVSRAMALDLSIALSDVGVLPAPEGIPFGDLRLTTEDCAGYSLRQLAHRAEMVAVGVRPPGDTCWSAATIETVVQTVLTGFHACEGVAAGVKLPVTPPSSP